MTALATPSPAFRSKHTHDCAGKPLPAFILRGAVAYVPVTPGKPRVKLARLEAAPFGDLYR